MADIAVWVKGREKLLTGVSRATTCQDIVKTLLKDNLKVDKISKSCAENFALYERWRDCERPLAPQTRVYKLWKAWGNEQENVKFVLKKYTPNEKSSKDSNLKLKEEDVDKMKKTHTKRKNTDQRRRESTKGLSVRGGNTHKAHKNSNNQGNRDNTDRDCRQPITDDSTGSSESELIPSTICGPEMIRGDDATCLPTSLLHLNKSSPSAETFNHLVQLVVRQSQQLEELLQQAQDIDREIEFYETKMHLLRVEENGKNYVQDAYLAHDEETESKMAELLAGMYPSGMSGGNDELETYIDLYERILRVEEQLSEKRSTITSLSRQIEEQRCAQSQCTDFAQELTEGTHTSTPISSESRDRERLRDTNTQQSGSTLKDEVGLARAQLEKSAQTCVAQRTELSTLQKRLQATETVLDDKCHWMRVLTVELQRLEETEKLMMMSSAEMTSSNQNHREEKRLQELLQLVRQPLQPIQETSEDEEETDETDIISQTTNDDDISLLNKPAISDDSSDTGLSSLHSQDEPEQMLFEIITETLV